MKAPKKRLAKIVEVASAMLGDDFKAKKLRKAKALKRFIVKLEDAERSLEKELSCGSLKPKRRKERERQVEILAKQIKKAKKTLEEMG